MRVGGRFETHDNLSHVRVASDFGDPKELPFGAGDLVEVEWIRCVSGEWKVGITHEGRMWVFYVDGFVGEWVYADGVHVDRAITRVKEARAELEASGVEGSDNIADRLKHILQKTKDLNGT